MGRLRKADSYSYMLAGVVYCVRVVAVEVLLPSAERAEQGTAERERFLERRREFLSDGSYSPMSTMLSLLAYSKSIALNKSNEGSVQWSADHKVLFLYGRRLVINRWQRMAQESVADAERMLWDDVMRVRQEER